MRRLIRCIDCIHVPDLASLSRAGDLAMVRHRFVPCRKFTACYTVPTAHHSCPAYEPAPAETVQGRETFLATVCP